MAPRRPKCLNVHLQALTKRKMGELVAAKKSVSKKTKQKNYSGLVLLAAVAAACLLVFVYYFHPLG